MANITDLKFLSLDGLSLVVTKLKSLITTAENKSKISNVNTTAASDKVTINILQGEGEGITTLTKSTDINSATQNLAGLMSAADKTKLDKIADGAQVNVVEGAIVYAEGDEDKTAIVMEKDGNKNVLIKNLATITATEPTGTDEKLKDAKLAPTAKAVRTYVEGKITTVNGAAEALTGRVTTLENDLNTATTGIKDRLTKAEGDITAVANRATDLETAVGNEATETSILGRLKTAENDIDSAEGRLDKAEDDIDAVENRATALETFIGAEGSRKVYTKTEVDTLQTNQTTELKQHTTDAVAALKKEILTGESNEQLDAAYDTLLEVAKWIASDKTGTVELTSKVTKNTEDIEALTKTVADNKTDIEGQLAPVSAKANQNEKDIDALTQTVEKNKTDIEKTVADLTQTVATNLNTAKTYTDDELKKLAYVEGIGASISSDNNGVLTLTYTVNGATADTTKSINFGSLIQESEINALFV